MEQLSSLATPAKQHDTLASLYEATPQLLDLENAAPIDGPTTMVLLDVDGTVLPDKPELTGRNMQFMYENGLFNQNTAEYVEIRGRSVKITAKQNYELLMEQIDANADQKSSAKAYKTNGQYNTDRRTNPLYENATDYTEIHGNTRRSSEYVYEEFIKKFGPYGESDDLTERRRLYDPLNKMHDAQIRGRKRSEVDAIANEVIRLCLNEAYQPILEEMDMHMREGSIVGFISGSPNFLIQSLKRALGVNVATGTQLNTSGGGRYHLTAPASPRGRDKHLIVDGMLRRASLNRMRQRGEPTTIAGFDGQPRQMGLEEIPDEFRYRLAAAYGDTVYDMTMLVMADDPVVVYDPNQLVAPVKRDLVIHGLKEGWRMLDVNTPPDPAYKFEHILSKKAAKNE